MPLLESYLIGAAGSVTADWLACGGTWILRRKPVAEAITLWEITPASEAVSQEKLGEAVEVLLRREAAAYATL